MMTRQETDAFIKNPGPPGIYRFQRINLSSQYEGGDRLRKWDGIVWYLGVDELKDEHDWINRAKRASMKVDTFSGILRSCIHGEISPYLFANLQGNRIYPRNDAPPEQLDLFDFN